MMLAIFNGPMAAEQFEQFLGCGLFGGQTGHGVDDLGGEVDGVALSNGLANAFGSEELAGASQADGFRVGGLDAELSFFDPAVAFIQRSGLRGENRL